MLLNLNNKSIFKLILYFSNILKFTNKLWGTITPLALVLHILLLHGHFKDQRGKGANICHVAHKQLTQLHIVVLYDSESYSYQSKVIMPQIIYYPGSHALCILYY